MFIVFFMTRDLTCIESNDKKFLLVLAVGVLQGDHQVQFLIYKSQPPATGMGV